MKNIRTYIAASFFVLVSCVSCIKEDFNLDPASAAVTFRIAVPAGTVASGWSRAGGASAYNIENMSVFIVNSEGLYKGRYVPTKLFAENETQTQWTANVKLPEIQDKVTLHFIANYNDMLPDDIDSQANIGKKIEELIPSFVDSRPDPNADGYGPFVMWGLVKLDALSSSETTEPISVSLIRNVSSVSIDFDPEIINNDIFQFEKMMLYNVRKAGTVSPFPFPDGMDQASLIALNKATEPPTGEIGNYEGEQGETMLYCYSRQNRTWKPALDRNSCTFIIIKGKYKNSKTPEASCYYRVEMATKEEDSQGNKIFHAQEILRNYDYRVRIDEISGPGYNTVEEAIKYPSSNNINTNLSVMPSEDIIDVTSNGQYKLGLSRSTVVLYGEPQQDDADWFEVAKVYAVNLIPPEDHTVGELPSLKDDLVCTVRNNADGVLMPDGMTEKDGKMHLKTEYHDDPYNPYRSILVKRTECQQKRRLATIDVQLGNLQNVITISQSQNQDFDIPAVVYVGWQSGLDATIPIKVANGSTGVNNLECTITLDQPVLGFLSYKNNQQKVTLVNQSSQVDAVLLTRAAYYAKSKDQDFYRSQKVIIDAEGFNPATVTVKQGKFLDGIYGTALVGILRGNEETDVYTTSFGNSEERWSAKVVQGEDFIRIGKANSGAAELTEIGSNTNGNIGFDYRLLRNTTGKRRFGKIEILYAKEQWVHNIYVCQGLEDVEVTHKGKTTKWASGNTVYHENDTALYVSKSVAYPGAMFKFGDLSYTPYDPIDPSWGLDYTPSSTLYTAAWNDVKGNSSNWRNWNPCPEGYRLPTADEFAVWNVKIDGEKAGDNEVAGRPYRKIAWGRVSNANSSQLRPGMLYIFLDDADNVTDLFFLAAGGVRSETAFAATGQKIHGNGKLLYGHFTGLVEDPENNFGNQGGGYWFSNNPGSGQVLSVDMYHDPNNNIGLDVLNAGGGGWLTISVNDAMPVRCVRK